MRTFRPAELHVVAGDLWVVDATQPIAAVLDRSGEPTYVSWPELPPKLAAADGERSFPTALAGGASLWVQEAHGQPVGRVTGDGLVDLHWAGGLRLLAAGPDCVWLAPAPSGQVILTASELHVRGVTREQLEGRAPVTVRGYPLPGQVVRIGVDGRIDRLAMPGVVGWARTDASALYVEVDTTEAFLGELGADHYDATPETRWLRLPWNAPPTTEAFTAVDADALPRAAGSVSPWVSDSEDTDLDLLHHGVFWRAGRGRPDLPEPSGLHGSQDAGESFGWFAYAPVAGVYFGDEPAADVHDDAVPPNPDAAEDDWRFRIPLVVEARDADGRVVVHARFEGSHVPALCPWESGVAVILTSDTEPTEVVAVAPDGSARVLLRAGDVGAHCRPLVPRPGETDSYLRQMTDLHPCPQEWGIEDAQTRIVGQWPTAELEWSFALPQRPGLRLRRRFRLFDELGRIDDSHLEYADTHLMEDIEAGGVPPATRAIDGVLDMPAAF